MLSAEEDPMWVTTQTGHRDWAMIIRVYGKWMPSADPNAGGKAVSLFGDMLAKAVIPVPKTAQIEHYGLAVSL